jgi:arylformamidase
MLSLFYRPTFLVGLAVALFGVLVPSVAVAASPPERYGVRTIKDVPYYEGPGADKVKHRLDLFLPRGRQDFPVVFFVHGGAWLHGDKSFLGIYSAIGSTLARQGIGTVVINYRLSPAVRHPEHIKDVARAFAWTYRHIGEYGGRPDQIFVAGHSAGAHLIALLATDERYLKAEGLSPLVIKGAIPLSGVYRIPEGVFPMVFGTEPNAWLEASPLHYARKGLPPFLILYADRDLPACGKSTSEAFGKALREFGNKVQTLEITGSSHIAIILSFAGADTPVSRAVLQFIQEVTAGREGLSARKD